MNLLTIANEIKAAQDQCKLIEPLTSRFADFNNGKAYAVAQMIHEMRIKEGAVPVGRKIGFTNPKMWSIYGVCEPIWGHIYDNTVIQMTGSKVQCRIGHFAEPKIEPEIVVHFRTSPPVSADPTEVFASIDWIAHGIEIVQSHFLGWKFQAADTIADWGLHATLIVGKPLEVKQLGADVTADIENFIVKLSCDGDMREHLRAYIFLWLILQFGFQRACFSLSQAALSTYRFLLSSVCFRLMKDCIFQATLCNPYLIPNVIPISMLAKTY